MVNPDRQRLQEQRADRPELAGPEWAGWWSAEPDVGRSTDDVSPWLDGSWERGIPRVATGVPDRVARLRALGNAVVPLIPELIGRAILAAEEKCFTS